MHRFKKYLDDLAGANSLEDLADWVFFPGMLPESKSKWWGDFKTRPTAHEGIDICFYRTRDGRIHHLHAGATVPAWSDGTVVNICDDFLGRSLVVAPEQNSFCDTRVLEVFSHLVPLETITPGARVQAGQVIAVIADPRARGSVLLPHLHLSCIEVPSHVPVQALDWSLFPFRENVNVINPVFV
jgi:hypothetical protein